MGSFDMKWAKEKPTRQGYYWIRMIGSKAGVDDQNPRVVLIDYLDRDELIVINLQSDNHGMEIDLDSV